MRRYVAGRIDENNCGQLVIAPRCPSRLTARCEAIFGGRDFKILILMAVAWGGFSKIRERGIRYKMTLRNPSMRSQHKPSLSGFHLTQNQRDQAGEARLGRTCYYEDSCLKAGT
jgi:hypothetical protein